MTVSLPNLSIAILMSHIIVDDSGLSNGFSSQIPIDCDVVDLMTMLEFVVDELSGPNEIAKVQF